MLEFSDAPYRFFEPRFRPALVPAARWYNRRIVLPGREHRVTELRLEGAEAEIRDLARRGVRLVFVANHPTHSDPQAVTEALRRLGVTPSFMAAYDVFLRSRFQAWVMQGLGNFSVDREGSDRRAMAAAVETIKAGKQSLTIFPEGNVYLSNDRVTPFLDGTAFLALKAQQALSGEPPVHVVPLSLKYTHLSEPRNPLRQRLAKLAEDGGHRFRPDAEEQPVESVFELGIHLLGAFLKRHALIEPSGTMPPPGDSGSTELGEILAGSLGKLLDDLERVLGPASADSGQPPAPLSRIRRIRSLLHQHRAYGAGGAAVAALENADESEVARLADKAILALRVHGYLEPYLRDRPTIDRYDETVERIAEDFYSSAMPRTGPRRAVVRVHAPMALDEVLEGADGRLRDAVSPLTRRLEGAVQEGIDAINAGNDATGGRLIVPE